MAVIGSRDLTIGSAINIVHGDQRNQTIQVRVQGTGRAGKQRRVHEEGDGLELIDEYRNIHLGDIYKVKQVGSREVWYDCIENGRLDFKCVEKRTYYHAKVYGDDRVYTGITYGGEGAPELWKEDFARYSGSHDSAMIWQLFGVNRSTVPALIFYDEWLPMAHLCSINDKFWTTMYATLLSKRLHCDYQELWLNSQSGHFSCGPQGPYYRSGQVSANLVEDLRSTADMLQIDTCVEFLSKSSLNLDGDVVDFASWLCWGNDICINDLFGIEHHCGRPCVQADGVVINWDRKGEGCCRRLVPKGYIHNEVFDFLDNLRFGSIYLGRQRCEIARKAQVHLYYFDELHEFPALVDRTLIEGGMTRFLFDFDASGSPLVGTLRVSHSPNFVVNGRTWLPQAHHHFTCDDDIESCFLLNFFVLIHGFYPRPTSSPRSKPDNREDGSCGTAAKPTVYFFVRPLPVRLSEVKDWLNSEPIFWSFDENGITRIPESTREELGLPDMTLGDPQVTLRAWPKHHYDAIHKWQITRGFDPSTPDFARSLGIPIFERVRPQKRQFEEVAKEKEPEASSTSPEKDGLDESFLSRLSKLSWWQAAADIPVGLM